MVTITGTHILQDRLNICNKNMSFEYRITRSKRTWNTKIYLFYFQLSYWFILLIYFTSANLVCIVLFIAQN